MANWYDVINTIDIKNKDDLEASIEADMKYIINHAMPTAEGRCKIPILESRSYLNPSDSQLFGIEHKTTYRVRNLNKIYQIGKFEKNFKSDPSGMAEIIQNIFNNNSTYDYDEKKSTLTKKTSTNPPTSIAININAGEVFINPNLTIKTICNNTTGPPPTFSDTLV